LARQLAEHQGIKHIELDNLLWLPNWGERSLEDFRELVAREVEADHWVVDGNYTPGVTYLVLPRAEAVIWLDYSFLRTMGRLLRRTCRRLTKEELCCNGNRERFWIHFTHKGLPWWLIVSFRRRRRQCDALMADPSLGHIRRIRVTNPRQVEALIEDVLREPTR
jgi:adenylate kinase family enzyme